MDTLKIEQNPKQKTIAEALGMSEKLYKSLHAAAFRYIGLQMVEGIKSDDTKENEEKYAKTAIWARFLESKEFKASKWTPKTANDFFMVGYILNCTTREAHNSIERFAQTQIGEKLAGLGIPGVKIEIVGRK